MAVSEKKSEPSIREVDDAFSGVREFKHRLELEKETFSLGHTDGWLEVTPEIAKLLYPKGLGINPQSGKPNTYFLREGIHCYLTGTRDAIEAQARKDSYEILGDPQPGQSDLKQ